MLMHFTEKKLRRLLPRPNPTNYLFEASIGDVKKAIQRAYDNWRYPTGRRYADKVWQGRGDAVSARVHTRAIQLIGHELLQWRDQNGASDSGILSKRGNENDALLSGQEAPYCESQIYYQEGVPLIYYADFHIHLIVLGERRTSVEIATLVPRIAVGVDTSFSPVAGAGLILDPVSPTTIEEYDILLRIGKELGIGNMPTLAVPAPNSGVKSRMATK